MRQSTRFAVAAVAAAGLLAGCETVPEDSRVDVIFHGGEVVTLDDDSSVGEAVAVAGGQIVAVGSDSAVLAMGTDGTRRVDLEGGTVLPGFNDSHVHLGTGDAPEVHDWTHLEDREELAAALRAADDSLPEGAWIQGELLNANFPEEQVPDRYELDDIVRNRPIVLTRGAHVMMLNSLGLEMVGIDRNSESAPGGTIEFDEGDEPTGILRESAAWRLVLEDVPRTSPTPETARSSLLSTLERLPPLGITSINVAGMRPEDLRHLQDLYAEMGDSLVRATVQLRLRPGYDAYDDLDRAVDETIEEMEGLGFHTGFGDDRLKLGAIKMSIDGGFTGQAFWSLEPYPDRPDFRGLVRIPEESLYPVAKRAHELGWQLGIHAIGDAAVKSTVDVLDRVLEEAPRPHRHYLHHVSVKPPEATLDKMSELGISVSSQPNFAYSIGEYALSSLRGERLETNNPQRSLVEKGIHLAYGSDGMPLGPLVGIYAAVSREGADGQVHGPGERMSVEEAVRAYTAGTAWLTFDEEKKGTLEPGKLADMVVLEENILEVDTERIEEIPVAMTVIGGRVVYRASR